MRHPLGNALLFGLAVISAAGCVGGSTDTTEQDKERLKTYVLDKAPDNLQVKLGINYDDKLTLLGSKVEPSGMVRPGQKVKVTMYWKADKDVEDGWNLFTHVIDSSGERVLNIDNVGPLREWRETRQAMAPSVWEAGKVYVDEQEFVVPAGIKTDKIQVVTGVWKDNDRLKIKSGPRDRENRGIVATIPTGVGPATSAPIPSTRVPMLRVDKLPKDKKIKIDGKLDDEAWRMAAATGPLVDVASGRPSSGAPVGGMARLLWNEEGLYLGFDVRDSDLIGGFKKEEKDPHLWTKDTVEIMVDPDGDGDNKDYYEIQINPQNLVFDSHFEDYNQPRKEPDGPFGHQEWSAKLKSAVTVNGTLDKPGDRDQGYVVEALLPWKSFHKAKSTPPKIGDEWRINFYIIQNNSGVSWSPILGQGNFHKASRFGRVLFGEPGWLPPGPPPGPTGMMMPPSPRAPTVGSGPRIMPRLRLPPTQMDRKP